jgi:hypothetical protein
MAGEEAFPTNKEPSAIASEAVKSLSNFPDCDV